MKIDEPKYRLLYEANSSNYKDIPTEFKDLSCLNTRYKNSEILKITLAYLAEVAKN